MIANHDGWLGLEMLLSFDGKLHADQGGDKHVEAPSDDPVDVLALTDETEGDRDDNAPCAGDTESGEEGGEAEVVAKGRGEAGKD